MGVAYKLDTIIEADESLCIGCGACVRACPGGLIARGDRVPIPIPDSWDQCIDCGHCVAICPTGAIRQRSMGSDDCRPIDVHLIPTWDQARQFLISRRSIRGFINRPIEKEKILQLLDVARHAPNGANRQVLRWLVIDDSAEVHRVAALTVEWMQNVKETNPALYSEANLELFVDPWKAGKDRISRGAPCIVQAYGPKDERTAPSAAMIAIAYVQLAATALGLGTTFAGSINTASQSYAPLLEALAPPAGHIPYGTFLIGYPTEKYERIPVRKPLSVTWRSGPAT